MKFLVVVTPSSIYHIVLQDQLRNLFSFPYRRENQLNKLLLIKKECLITVAKITPIIPLKPTYIINITFAYSQLSMCVGSRQLKYIFRCHVDDPPSSFKTVAPKTIGKSNSFISFLTDSFIKPMYNSVLLTHGVTSSKTLRFVPMSLHNARRLLDVCSPAASKNIDSGAPTS